MVILAEFNAIYIGRCIAILADMVLTDLATTNVVYHLNTTRFSLSNIFFFVFFVLFSLWQSIWLQGFQGFTTNGIYILVWVSHSHLCIFLWWSNIDYHQKNEIELLFVRIGSWPKQMKFSVYIVYDNAFPFIAFICLTFAFLVIVFWRSKNLSDKYNIGWTMGVVQFRYSNDYMTS